MSSKKLKIVFVVMAVLLLAVIAVYLLVDGSKSRQEESDSQEAAALHLFDFDSGAVTAVELENESGSFRVEKEDGTWVLTDTSIEDFALNPAAINSICTAMSSLTAQSRTLPEGGEATDFTDAATAICYVGETAYTVYIGNDSALGDASFAMVPGDPHVYSLDTTAGETLRSGFEALRDRHLVPFSDVAIDHVSLTRQGETVFDITLTDGVWRMNAPFPAMPVDFSMGDSFVTTITRLETSGVEGKANENSLAEHGLDNPAYVLTAGTPEESLTLDFAEYGENDLTVYLCNETTEEILTMDANSCGFLSAETVEFAPNTYLPPLFSEASALEVTAEEDLGFTMELTGDAWTLDGEPLAGTDAQVLYAAFASAVAFSGTVTPGDTPPEDADTFCRALYTLKDGSEEELTLLTSKGGDDLYVCIDGEFTGLFVNKDIFVDLAKDVVESALHPEKFTEASSESET